MSARQRAEQAESVPVASVPGRYTPRLLVQVAQWCRANPAGRVEVRDWTRQTMSAAQWLGWFSAKLAEKINARDPRHIDTRRTKTGRACRKGRGEYAIELGRLRAALASRIVIRPHSFAFGTLGARVKAALAERFAD